MVLVNGRLWMHGLFPSCCSLFSIVFVSSSATRYGVVW